MKYKATVIRIGYRELKVEVEADSLEEAEKKVREKAYDTEFPAEHTADYEIDSILPTEGL